MGSLILDLDGTLVESEPGLRAALNRVLGGGFTREAVVGMIGDGVEALVRRALAARGREFDPAVLAAFRTEYDAHAAAETTAFPGTAEALRALRAQGWRLAVCTNKPASPARAILDRLGLLPLLDGVAGGDGPRKPDPAHMRAALAACGGEPAQAVAVGDHRNDVRAARAAGLGAVFAGWGYGPAVMAEGAPVAADLAAAGAIAREMVRSAGAG